MISRGARCCGHDDGSQHEEHAVDCDGDAAAIVQHQRATQKGTKARTKLRRADNEALCLEVLMLSWTVAVIFGPSVCHS
jgi:hypothetical protein